MEMPPATSPSSGSSSSGESGTPPERPTYAPPAPETPRTRETESLDVSPANADGAEPPRDEVTGRQSSEEAPAIPALRPFAPQPPPPMRYGEPRPAITSNRIGEPIRTSEPGMNPRLATDPNATTRLSPSNTPSSSPSPSPQAPQQNAQPNAYPPPAGSAPVGTPLSPSPMPAQPQAQAQPQAPMQDAPPQPEQQTTQWSSQPPPPPQPPQQPQSPSQPQQPPQPAAGTGPTYYPYPPQMPSPAPAPAPQFSQPPRPYSAPNSTPTYPPPANSPASAYASGYAPAANTLAPAMPATRTAGANNGLLTIIAVLLAIIALFQIINTFRPTRFDGAQPVQVQTKSLSQGTRDQVKDTLDKAQKSITDVNTQATQDYNAATTDAQRQAILAKYSFTLQQIVAQQQNDMLRIMQEQNTP